MKKLPTVLATISHARNPNWISEVTECGRFIDTTGYYLPPFEAEVEVLTVHFNTGKMQVRWVDPFEKKVLTYNIPNDAFLAKYPLP
jgi:hypothetical protein